MQLEPEQEHLFMEMAEATLAAPRDRREWMVFEFDGGAMLAGPGGKRNVIATDVQQLARVGLLQTINLNPATYMLPPEAITVYGEMKTAEGSAAERVEAEVRSLLDSEAFRRRTRRRTRTGRMRSGGCGERTPSAN